jgi:hypothetical protein
MLPAFLLGIALLAGGLLLAYGFVRADPKQLIRAVKWTVAGLLGALVIYLAFKGRLGYAAYLAPLVASLFMRWRNLARLARSFAGPSPGRSSEVRTDYLHMTLDHDSGALKGDVLKGACKGRRIEELSLKELLALLAECRAADPQSAAIIEAYLDRMKGSEWREQEASGGARGAGGRGMGAAVMSREEAFEILGLEPGASREEIHDAYRRLMGRFHPDQGGSNYLAAQINQAKELLLGG